MKALRLLLLLAPVLIGTAASANGPTETAVGVGATQVPIPSGAPAVLVANNGPADIWCAPTDSTKAAVGKGLRLQANGGSVVLTTQANLALYCIAPLAQVTGKATVVTPLAGLATVEGALYPKGYVMAPKAPTKLTAVAAGEVHVQLSQAGACIRFGCSVDVAYQTSSSTAILTATADSNDLFVRTIEKICLQGDYISIWMTAAGTCKVSETVSP